MKIKPYITKLSSSKEYKSFQKKYDDAFMMAGFFILDFETGKNMHQIDYYVPSEKKIAAFTMDGGVTMQMLEMINSKLIPEKLDLNTKVDLDALKGILEDEMKNRGITDEIKKIIAILQTIEGKKVWNLNCVLTGMDILKAHVDDSSQTVLKMEKSSILDYIKKMPGGMQNAIKSMPGMNKPNTPALKNPESEGSEDTEDSQETGESVNVSGGNLKEKLQTLNKLEEEIEIEKEKAESELDKKSKKSKKSKPIKSKK